MEDARQASIGIVNGQRLYSTTPEIQAFTDVSSAAEYFQYTNQWGEVVSPIDKDSFEGVKLSVLRELSEGIKWARDSFNIGSEMPRTIRRTRLGHKTLGDYDDIRREIRYKLGLTEEYAYSTAVHEMAHHADNIMGHPAGDIIKAATKKLRGQYSIKQLNRMKDEIAMEYSNDVHELLAYSLDKYCIGKGNILAQTISEAFLRRCRER